MWDYFNSKMKENGYSIVIENNYQKRGTIAYDNDDKWKPIIDLYIYGAMCFNIFVYNRCGHNDLHIGPTIAYYEHNETFTEKDIETFKQMVDYIIKKWSEYGTKNPYNFTENKNIVEHKEFGGGN